MQSEEIFQTIPELDSVMGAEEKGKKPCNIQIDPKISVKILFHYKPEDQKAAKVQPANSSVLSFSSL